MNVDCKSKEEGMDDMPGNEGVDIDLYADDIEQDFNTVRDEHLIRSFIF